MSATRRVPATRNGSSWKLSAETSTRGSITKAGDPVMRSLFIEAAWTAIRKDAELTAFYQRVKKTHASDKASRIAIVAVARKLVAYLMAVDRGQRRFQTVEASNRTAA